MNNWKVPYIKTKELTKVSISACGYFVTNEKYDEGHFGSAGCVFKSYGCPDISLNWYGKDQTASLSIMDNWKWKELPILLTLNDLNTNSENINKFQNQLNNIVTSSCCKKSKIKNIIIRKLLPASAFTLIIMYLFW